MKYLIYLALVVCTIPASAQRGNFVMSYPIGFPMGNFHDYISTTSFRGISLEFLNQVKPGVMVGIESGWNVFYQKEDEKEYKDGTVSVTGIQYRYTNSVPLLAQVKYLRTSGSGKSTPFVGLGIGTLYVSRSTDIGLYRITTDAWQFCLRPELGFTFKSQSGASPYISAKYNAAFNTDELDGQSFLSLNIGILFSSR